MLISYVSNKNSIGHRSGPVCVLSVATADSLARSKTAGTIAVTPVEPIVISATAEVGAAKVVAAVIIVHLTHTSGIKRIVTLSICQRRLKTSESAHASAEAVQIGRQFISQRRIQKRIRRQVRPESARCQTLKSRRVCVG